MARSFVIFSSVSMFVCNGTGEAVIFFLAKTELKVLQTEYEKDEASTELQHLHIIEKLALTGNGRVHASTHTCVPI